MLLRRSLFVLDIIVLLAIVVFLVFLPAERCAHFEARETPLHPDCNIHPVHHPEFSFTQNLKNHEHLEDHKHLASVCHLLQWSHYKFWESMYLILLPAITCVCLIAYTVCEICEFDLFVGQVRSTSLAIASILTVFYTIGVISHEKNRIRNDWPFLQHVQYLGAEDSSIHVSVPMTWQYSIALCILSALFKIGRLLIQHYFGDKKFSLDEDVSPAKKENPPSSTQNLLHESTFSRLDVD